jgi:hypothetical protein
VFSVPGATPADGADPSLPSTPANASTASIAEPAKTEERTAEPVLEINTAQLRAAKIWAHNIARKLFKRSSPDEASFRFRHRT